MGELTTITHTLHNHPYLLARPTMLFISFPDVGDILSPANEYKDLLIRNSTQPPKAIQVGCLSTGSQILILHRRGSGDPLRLKAEPVQVCHFPRNTRYSLPVEKATGTR